MCEWEWKWFGSVFVIEKGTNVGIEWNENSAEISNDTTLEDLETWCHKACEIQRAIHWWIGDMARAVDRLYPNSGAQAWPEWASPDMIARCKAVAASYLAAERNLQATWTTHMNMAKRPDRVEAVLATVESGQTSDEARKNPPPVSAPRQEDATERTQNVPSPPDTTAGWLLAVDMNYFIHRYFHSGAGPDAAATFVQWLLRLVVRLAETKGLTDLVCCVDSATSFRKALTQDWEHQYKPRTEKEPELANQLTQAPGMLQAKNISVVSIPFMEADDVMASYAKQFNGRVTLLTQDKDLRQCLSSTCNILLDVTWEEDPSTNKQMPVYKWVSAKQHVEDGSTYASTKVAGITPTQWPHFQAIAGDATDGIRGCEGIGAKGAMELIKLHGTVQGVIDACHDQTINLSQKKLLAVLDFEPLAATMLKLTTLRDDLEVPQITRLCLKDTT